MTAPPAKEEAWMKIDLHIHLEQGGREYALLNAIRAAEAGMEGAVFFEHNAPAPPAWWGSFAASSPIPSFYGCEYSSGGGHLLVITPDGSFPHGPLFRPMQEMIDLASSLQGAAIAAHPYTRMHSRPLGDGIFALKGLAAVETINGAQSLAANQAAEEARCRMGLPGVGGSDAHNPNMTGRAFTMFRERIGSQEGLVQALKTGRYSAQARAWV